MAKAATTRQAEQTVKAVPVLAIRDQVHFPGLVNTVHVLRERSLMSARRALAGDRLLLVVSQRDMGLDEPSARDLAEIGTLSEVLHSSTTVEGGLRVVLRGLSRARPLLLQLESGAFEALPEPLPDRRVRRDERTEALMRDILHRFSRLAEVHVGVPAEAVKSVSHLDRPGELADAIAHFLPLRPEEKQNVLETLDPLRRLDLAHHLLSREERLADLQETIRNQVDREVVDAQRQFYLREQLRVIQQELREPDEIQAELQQYREQIHSLELPDAVRGKVELELKRLERQPTGSAEAGQMRSYLDLLLEMPWGMRTTDCTDLAKAAEVLENEHYGLSEVKERVLEFLAVQTLRQRPMGGALCFVGPPGVGKTGFAKALATAMGRKVFTIALGGLRDEAEIRGHRRTYVGAMPGRIAQGLRNVGSMNPVIVLDEIDKMAMDMRGDPAAALLEALDREQSASFQDHYLEMPIDLSQVVFVATANVWDTLPGPLRDRMECIAFDGYTDEERVIIARRYLAPRAAAAHGLTDASILSDAELERLVREQIREPGLRGLDREIARICRRVARRQLGAAISNIHDEPAPKSQRTVCPGVVWGIAVGAQGGTPLRVEAVALPVRGNRPTFEVTGNMGTVMQESAQAALSAARASISADFGRDLHIHVPAGAVPKDGPSAGLAMVAALASAVSGLIPKADIACTGEITLTGQVLAVGGIKEKLLAAHRAGFRAVVLPDENRADFNRLPPEVRNDIDAIFVTTVKGALTELLLPS
jgi:ATP-dependent Lon protease